MRATGAHAAFLEQRQQLMDQAVDPVLKKHFQAEIDLIKSWGAADIGGHEGPDDAGDIADIGDAEKAEHNRGPFANLKFVSATDNVTPTPNDIRPDFENVPPVPQSGRPGASGDFNSVPDGYGNDWHTIRYSNTTNEAINMKVTVASGQPLPQGTDANGNVTIPPGGFVDLTYPPGSSANFKSTKGDGSVWNQGEVYFDEANKAIYGNMSYIYGANSNMRMFSEDGQHSGYLGDAVGNAPGAAKVGNWGIMAPYDRFHHSDDPNNPNSAAGGPDGPKNAGADYLYDILDKGEGYVGRGRPVEITDYDDASSLRFNGKLAVVF